MIRSFSCIQCVFTCWLLLGERSYGQLSPLDYWTWQNPQVNGNTLGSIVFGNGMYVAAGAWGTVLNSRDGIHWQNKSLPISTPLGYLTFGNGLFVMYGVDNSGSTSGNSISYLMTSMDGENWSVIYTR